MFEMTKTMKTGEKKVVKVPHAIGEAVVVGGLSAVMGVALGFVKGAVTDIKHVLKNRKNK